MKILIFKYLINLLVNSPRRITYVLLSSILISLPFIYNNFNSFYDVLSTILLIVLFNITAIFLISIYICLRHFYFNNQYGQSEKCFLEIFNFIIGISLIHIIQLPLLYFGVDNFNLLGFDLLSSNISIFLFIIFSILSYYNVLNFKFLNNFLFKKDKRGTPNLELVKGDNSILGDLILDDIKENFFKVRIDNEYRNSFYSIKNKDLSIKFKNKIKGDIIKLAIGKKGNKGFYNESGKIRIKLDNNLILDKSIKNLKKGWNDFIFKLPSSSSKKILINVQNNNRIYINTPQILKKNSNTKNIILLCVDGLRKDMLGLYSGQKGISNNIDNFFKDYNIYDNAYAQGEWTFPTHASMMTGQYTSHHGVRNKDYRVEVPKKIEVLPEILQKKGYNTFGYFSCFRLSPHFGFSRGFNKTIYKNNALKVSHYELNNFAIDSLKHSSNQNNFIFLHYMDIHPPYLNNSLFSTNTAPYDYDINKLYNLNIEKNSKESEYINIMKDNKIREFDFQLGRLFSNIKNLNMLDNTAFILFSDHGVNIPSDGISNWKDKFLTNQRLNVPLLIRCPWMMKNNKFHNNFFVESSIDLLPTVMEIAGINSFNSSDYSLSCMSQKIGTKNFKDYAVSEYIWEGEYKCKIHTFKYIYNREFNWLNDNEEKEFIIDIKTNKKIKIKSTLYFELITYFRDINKKLNLKTLKCKN